VNNGKVVKHNSDFTHTFTATDRLKRGCN